MAEVFTGASASYARQATDDSLEALAMKIRKRAILRSGQILREIEPRKNQYDAMAGDGPSRKQAASDAGMSERQNPCVFSRERYCYPMSSDSARLYFEFKELVRTRPDLQNSFGTEDTLVWIGRVAALLEASGNGVEAIKWSIQSEHLGNNDYGQQRRVQTMDSILYCALASAERDAPKSMQGAFIPTGGSFTAHTAILEVLETATKRVLMVDPFSDAKILNDFAVLAAVGVEVRILADEKGVKPTLRPAAEAWKNEYGNNRPLELRFAQARSLHDRMIIVDERDVWTIGQSFKDIATRAPTSLQKLDVETAGLKIEADNEIWASAIIP